jgi:hypothetical protein
MPVHWPRIDESKPEAAVLETRISPDHHRFADYEPLPFTEIGTEAVFRYSAFASGTQSQRRLLALLLLFSRVAFGTLVIVRIGLLLTLGLLFVPYEVALLLFSRPGLFLLFYRLGLRLNSCAGR